MHFFIFLWNPRFILPEYFLNFFSNLYIPAWLRKNFKLMVLRLLEKTFANQNIESIHYYPYLKVKFSPRFLLSPLQAEGNYPFRFWKSIFMQQKRGRIMEMKKSPKLNLRGYWSQVLMNFTIFAILNCFVFVLLCHN